MTELRTGTMSIDRVIGFKPVNKYSQVDKVKSQWLNRIKSWYPDIYPNVTEIRFRVDVDKHVPKSCLVLTDNGDLYEFFCESSKNHTSLKKLN